MAAAMVDVPGLATMGGMGHPLTGRQRTRRSGRDGQSYDRKTDQQFTPSVHVVTVAGALYAPVPPPSAGSSNARVLAAPAKAIPTVMSTILFTGPAPV